MRRGEVAEVASGDAVDGGGAPVVSTGGAVGTGIRGGENAMKGGALTKDACPVGGDVDGGAGDAMATAEGTVPVTNKTDGWLDPVTAGGGAVLVAVALGGGVAVLARAGVSATWTETADAVVVSVTMDVDEISTPPGFRWGGGMLLVETMGILDMAGAAVVVEGGLGGVDFNVDVVGAYLHVRLVV